MSSALSHAQRDRAEVLSQQECRAIRALDRDDDYTRSEIAFMFEIQVGTVADHADRDCHHNRIERTPGVGREYSDGDLLDAFRRVYDRQPYWEMSQGVYDDYRPDAFPSATSIRQRFGGWPAARERAWGDRDA